MTSWHIDYQNEHTDLLLAEKPVESFLKELLQELSNEPIPETVNNLSVTFTDDLTIAELNKQYRHKTGPTDVLSFSLLEGEDDGPQYSLGDIVISLDTCLRQAKEYGISSDHECARLLIHGLLHLFGYDHENVSEAEVVKMQTKEDLLITVFEKNAFVFFMKI